MIWVSGVEQLSAAELELLVHCKLEMANIAKQRHHGIMAAHIVLQALKLLQGAGILAEKDSKHTRFGEYCFKLQYNTVECDTNGH